MEVLCCTNLISHQTAQGTLPLRGYILGNTGGPNFAWLGDHNVTEVIFLIVVVQNVLWQLGGFATACGSSNNHYRVVLYERNQLETAQTRTHIKQEQTHVHS